MTAHLKEPTSCAPPMEQGRLGHDEAEQNWGLPFALAEGATAPFGPAAELQVRRYLAEMMRAPQYVRDQRRSVAAFLERSGVGCEPQYAAVVAVSELLSNAVLYGGTDTVGLSVAYGSFLGKVRIAVNDRTPGLRGEPCRPEADQEGGRGLLLVGALADEWGVSEDGCSTWCTIEAGTGGIR
ncbi:ATP-binding protein [Streptomyces sp. NPDC057557]|uniref:ATP-binding protein n=1 Tax=Streptomyces sp. NPDC057557 TaxID=3346167 RepID=UPI0036B16097